jgi:hypothetical protein
MTFINESENKFIDIGSEEYRIYRFPEGEVRIDAPRLLSVSAGGHRVFDDSGVSHYIPKGWIHLRWKAWEGKPNFVK